MTKKQLYDLKIGDILTNKISNKRFKIYDTIAYGTFLLLNQQDLIIEYLNPCNCSIYIITS